MEVLYPRCAGAGCPLGADHRGGSQGHDRAPGVRDHDSGSAELAAWLTEAGCTHVAGGDRVYWKPVWHVLEDEASFTLVIQRAAHPKRSRTQRKDATWIADLLAHR